MMADMIVSRSGLPQPPQQKGLATALLSVGEDVSDIGQLAFRAQEARANSWLQYDLKLKEIAAKHKLDLEEVEARKQADLAKDAAKEEEVKARAKEIRKRTGVHETMLPKDDPLFATMIDDESGGHTGPADEKKYGQYKEDQKRGYIMSEVFARKPEAADDAAKGYRSDWFTGRMQNAPDTEGVRREAQAEGGKVRHHMGEAGVMDDWGGKVAPTDLSRAKVNRENAGAAQNSAQARAADALANERIADAERKARTGGMTANEIYKQLSDLNQEETRVNTRLKEFQFDNEISAAERDNLSRIQKLREELRGELAKLRQPGGKQARSGDAPYPDGTRLRGKDGKMYIVKNGKPVPEGK